MARRFDGGDRGDPCRQRWRLCIRDRLAALAGGSACSGEPQRELPIWTDVAIEKVLQRFRKSSPSHIAPTLDFAGDIL